jgi:mevalonate kinase
MVNGYRLHERHHSYLMTAIEHCWKRDDHVRLQTEGGVPSASGTGSSAALTVAAVAGLLQLQGDEEPADVAQQAFEVERLTQGGGSPTDTSTSTAGGAIAIAGAERPANVGEVLWELAWKERRWLAERVPLGPLTMVVGNSGVKGRTDAQVAKVAHAAKKNRLVRDTLVEIGALTREAVPALAKNDWVTVGALMGRAHGCLHTLGVNHEAVQRLVDGALATPGTLGAKLTGAGGGGSMIALSEQPEKVAQAIRDLGGTAFIVQLGGPGVAYNEAMAPA